MRAEDWRGITRIAKRQGGLVTSAQLNSCAASPRQVDQLIHERRLLRVRKGVVAVAGVPEDAQRPVRAAALATPGSVVSHRTAAWLHGLLSQRPGLVDITLAARKVQAIGVLGHRAEIPPEHVADCLGIPVTAVPWTLVDLMASLPISWVERLVHESVMRRLCSYREVKDTAAERPDDACAAAMIGLLGDRDGSTPLESHWLRVLRAAGLPEPVQQLQVVIDDRVYVLDFAWPDHKVALEVNGFTFHRTREAFDRDHEKSVALQATGWTVVAATAKTPPAPVLATLQRAISTTPGVVEIAGG